MFERLTPPGRQVMARAEQESDRLRHNYIGPEHVLAGLAADDGPAGRALRERGLHLQGVRAELDRLVDGGVLLGPYRDDTELLRSLGIDLEAVRAAVAGAFGTATVEETARRVARRGAGRTPPWGWPPMGKGLVAKRALQLAVEEAEALGRDEVGPEHLLLGVLRDAQLPVKVPRCFRLPRSRQSRAYSGIPEPDRPSPVMVVLEARSQTVDTLRQAVLAEFRTTA